MKVALFNHTSAISGAEISLLLTAKHFKNAEAVLFAPEGELLQRARQQGTRVVAVNCHTPRLSRNPFTILKAVWGIILSGWRIMSAIKKQDVDLIHANSIRAGIMAALFFVLHRKPIVWHVRDMPPTGMVGKLIKRFAGITSDAFIGISTSVVHSFQDSGLSSRMHLVHNGVEIGPKVPEEEKVRIRAKLRTEIGASGKVKVLAVIGQITPWKRQMDAIRVARRLIEERQDIQLWIVGEAKFRDENVHYERELKQFIHDAGIEDHIVFTGFRQDIMEICCAADMLLLCSDNEPFGRVIIEAMSQELPVIATKAGGVTDIITDPKNGLLYPVGDTEELYRSISALLEDEPKACELGRNGRQRVVEHFDIKNTAAKVEAVYAKVMA